MNTQEKLVRASAVLNRLAEAYTPWRRDGAIITLTTDPLAESPSTPAWYEPTRGDITVNLDAVFSSPGALSDALGDIERDTTSKSRTIVWGLVAHEAAHSAWTKWKPSDLGEEVSRLAVQIATLFEEIRIEKRAVDRSPGRAIPMLRGSFGWLLEKFSAGIPEMDMRPLSIAHTWALVHGRYVAGIAALSEVEPIDSLTRTALGDDTVEMMQEILDEAVQTSSPRHLGRLAQEWVDLLKEDDDDEGGEPQLSNPIHGDSDGDEGDDSDSARVAGAGYSDEELAEVLADVVDQLRRQIEETPIPPQPEMPLANAQEWASKVFRPGVEERVGSSNWMYFDPTPELRSNALRLSRTLERLALPAVTLTHTPSELPPGRLRGREMVRQGAERSMGMMSTATPWERSKRRRTHIKPVIVGVMTDTSGSMSWAEQFVAEFAWTMGTAGHRIGARTAAVTFGANAEMVTRPGEIPTKVRRRRANGPYEEFDTAMAAMDGVLHLSVPNNAAKILFVVSDGQFVKEGMMLKAEKWIQQITQGGTLVVWLGGHANRLNMIKTRAKPGMFQTTGTLQDPARLMAAMEAVVIKAAGSLV